MNKARIYIIVLILLNLMACRPGQNRFDVDLPDIDPIKIKRYGQALFEIDTSNIKAALEGLQPQFPIFLEADLNNPQNITSIRNFVKDTFLVKVYNDTRIVYPDLTYLEKEITKAFSYYSYYFPGETTPSVFTYISAFDYEHRVQLYQFNVLIALDMYLGEDYPDYKQLGVPLYILRKFQPDYIVRDVMNEFAKARTDHRQTGNKLLEQMIYEGKLLWFIHAMVPDLQEQILFDYSADQLEWIHQNEQLVWAFIIENELLYKSDPGVSQKLIKEGPFTSYFGQQSPPRLGWWIGYQIVDRYMVNHPNVTLEAMLQNADATLLLKESKYKPE